MLKSIFHLIICNYVDLKNNGVLYKVLFFMLDHNKIMIILKYMNLFALFSKLYYVTKIHIILDLLFYNYLQFYKFANLQILIKSFHINTIKIFTSIQFNFYKYFTHNYNYNYNFTISHKVTIKITITILESYIQLQFYTYNHFRVIQLKFYKYFTYN